MSETGGEAEKKTAAFETLGHIVTRVGHGAVRETLAVAAQFREQGLYGPAVGIALATEEGPAYALAFKQDEVSFTYGGDSGKLPVSALEALAQQHAAAEAAQQAPQN